MSTENPRISNFVGLEQLAALMDEFKLEVSDRDQKTALDSTENRLTCDEAAIPKVGLRVVCPPNRHDFAPAAELAHLTADQVSLMVVAEDAFLKERAVLAEFPVAELEEGFELVGRGKPRHRALLNSREGISLELALVLNTELTPQPGRPRRLGTKLATTNFKVKGDPASGGINPVELTDEVIKEKNLSRKTHLYLSISDDLLTAASLTEAITVYANKDLINALKLRRTGTASEFVGTYLAVNALQQLVFALSSEIHALGSNPEINEDAPILTFVQDKLNEVRRVGAEELSPSETIDLLRDNPREAAAVLTGLSNYSKDARKLVEDAP